MCVFRMLRCMPFDKMVRHLSRLYGVRRLPAKESSCVVEWLQEVRSAARSCIGWPAGPNGEGGRQAITEANHRQPRPRGARQGSYPTAGWGASGLTACRPGKGERSDDDGRPSKRSYQRFATGIYETTEGHSWNSGNQRRHARIRSGMDSPAMPAPRTTPSASPLRRRPPQTAGCRGCRECGWAIRICRIGSDLRLYDRGHES